METISHTNGNQLSHKWKSSFTEGETISHTNGNHLLHERKQLSHKRNHL
jgi:hypothetical protein